MALRRFPEEELLVPGRVVYERATPPPASVR